MPEYLLGIHDFRGRTADELNISKGDYVEVIEDDAEFGDSWYIGRNLATNKTGLFPKVFTKEVDAPSFLSGGNSEYEEGGDMTATIDDIDQALQEMAVNATPSEESVLYWTPYDVRAFVLSRGYSEGVADRFVQHQITGAILLELDINSLKEIDIPSFGTRFELSKEIKTLAELAQSAQTPYGSLPSPPHATPMAAPAIDKLGSPLAVGKKWGSTTSTPNSNDQRTATPASEMSDMTSFFNTHRHSRSVSDLPVNADFTKKLTAQAATSPVRDKTNASTPGKGHHRRHSSVNSILDNPKSPPHKPGSVGREKSDSKRLKGFQNMKPQLVKQKTSAFLEGIRDTTAEKAAANANYSGWMQKKGGVGMGTWRARYFTLHGTRLSYFTNFKDTKERGLIDITGHRAIPIGDNEDKLLSLYAAGVGAGRFCFKLVPPGPGFRKGVSFTAPKTHYFAVETKEELRSWINALTKATIERDESVPPVSSCTTPVVSLPKAQEIIAERLQHYFDSDDYDLEGTIPTTAPLAGEPKTKTPDEKDRVSLESNLVLSYHETPKQTV